MKIIACNKIKQVFVPQLNVKSIFFLLEEGNEKWPYFLHNFKYEMIASGIQFAGSDDSGCNNRYSGHTLLSKFGGLPLALKTN